MAEKIIVLTIANKGVGLALTNALVASSKKVPAIDPSGKELASLVQEKPNACLATLMPSEQKSLDDTQREFDVSYFGCLSMIQLVQPMIKASGGSEVNWVKKAYPVDQVKVPSFNQLQISPVSGCQRGDFSL